MSSAFTAGMKSGLQFLVSQTSTKGDSKSINEGMEKQESWYTADGM